MSFDDAYAYAYPACLAQLREARTRELLDSLRVAYNVNVNEALVRRARVESDS